jgi:uncharacterized RDD family membrane protein YckC
MPPQSGPYGQPPADGQPGYPQAPSYGAPTSQSYGGSATPIYQQPGQWGAPSQYQPYGGQYAAVAPELSGLGPRIAARIVDSIIVSIIVTVPILIGLAVGSSGFMFLMVLVAIGAAVYYAWGLEATRGQTLGKQWLGIRVIKDDGTSPPGWGAAIIRNLLLIVDQLPFLYILGMICIASSQKKQRIGDMAAHTLVVRA